VTRSPSITSRRSLDGTLPRVPHGEPSPDTTATYREERRHAWRALHALRRAGFGWAQAAWFQVASIGAAVALTILEFFLELRGLEIVAREEFGALSYTNAEPPSGPPLMVLIVAAVLIIVGAMVWKCQGWPWLFVGAVVMTIGSAIQLPVESNAITNAFELALLTSIMATKAFQDRRSVSGTARHGEPVGEPA
jgi:hypothetical protein